MARYCARLQLALLQNVEDNLVREQAELDLVGRLAGEADAWAEEKSKAKVSECEGRVNVGHPSRAPASKWVPVA